MVKMFFRELPEPILTFNMYHDFMNTSSKSIINQHCRYRIELSVKSTYCHMTSICSISRDVTTHIVRHQSNTTFTPPLKTAVFPEIDVNSRERALLELVHKLPRVNFLVFERLIYHLAQVANEVSIIFFV